MASLYARRPRRRTAEPAADPATSDGAETETEGASASDAEPTEGGDE